MNDAQHSSAESPTEGRLTALEIKASFTDDLLEQLDAIIARQQREIDALRRELAALRDSLPADNPATPRSLLDERPPHY